MNSKVRLLPSNTTKLDISYISTIWLIIFVFIPISLCFYKSFSTDADNLTLKNYFAVLKTPFLYTFIKSITLATITTIVSMCLVYPTAIFLKAKKIGESSILNIWFLITIYPFLGNSLLRIYSLKRFILSPLNTFIPLYSEAAIIIGMVYVLFPLALLPIYFSLLEIPDYYLEAAKDLGASNIKIFYHIIIPLTLKAAKESISMVSMPSLSLFFVVQIIGSGKTPFLSNVIKEQVLSEKNFNLACASSVMLMLMVQIAYKFAKKIYSNYLTSKIKAEQ